MKKFKGKVIRGDGKANKTGYPTANLPNSIIKKNSLKNGVYAAWAFFKNKKHPAALICGVKNRKGLKKLEIYILDYQKNLYEKSISIEVVKKIRALRNFKTKNKMIAQAKKDLKKIKKILKI